MVKALREMCTALNVECHDSTFVVMAFPAGSILGFILLVFQGECIYGEKAFGDFM
jgi:hypothetical protein